LEEVTQSFEFGEEVLPGERIVRQDLNLGAERPFVARHRQPVPARKFQERCHPEGSLEMAMELHLGKRFDDLTAVFSSWIGPHAPLSRLPADRRHSPPALGAQRRMRALWWSP